MGIAARGVCEYSKITQCIMQCSAVVDTMSSTPIASGFGIREQGTFETVLSDLKFLLAVVALFFMRFLDKRRKISTGCARK